MKPHSKVTLPGLPAARFKPLEMAVLAAVFAHDGFVSLDYRASSRVTFTAKRCLAAWLGSAFFAQERRGFTDKLILDAAVKLTRRGQFLTPSGRIPDAAALTALGRLAALAIKAAYDKPLGPEEFYRARAAAEFARSGRFAP